MKKLIVAAILFFSSQICIAQDTILLRQLLNDIQQDSLYKTVLDLQSFGTRFCFNPNTNKGVALYLQERYKQTGINNTQIDSFYLSDYSSWIIPLSSGWQYNSIATIIGSTQPDDICIVGAHLDNIAAITDIGIIPSIPGADDNATGIAVALEIARLFKKYNIDLKKTVRFEFYDSEEIGLFGSIRCAERAKNNEEKIVFMLNNDMVGVDLNANKKIKVVEYPNALDLSLFAKEVINDYTNLEAVADTTFIPFSDSYSYFINGLKSVFFIEDKLSPYYHSIKDSIGYIDLNYLTEATKISLAMLFLEATSDTISINELENFDNKISVYPNPTSNSINITMTLKEQSNVLFKIFNIYGSEIFSTSKFFATGENSLNINTQNWNPGVYFCNISIKSNQKTIKFIVK